MTPKIFSIEGNIGAGKTTLVDNFQKYCSDMGRNDIVFLREPVDIWDEVRDPLDGETILKKFYKNPGKYAFPFQVMAFISRLSLLEDTIKQNPNCSVIICERSLCADSNIFAKMLYDDALIENVCFQIYSKIYKEFSGRFVMDGIIYMDASPEKCFQRITKRGRDGEGGIEMEYLQKCKKYHDEWLLHNEKTGILHLQVDENATYTKNDVGIKWIDACIRFIQRSL
jgi:deoxyadenosine/deoxycytidine kinase